MNKKILNRVFTLVVQWLRIHLTIKVTWVQPQVVELRSHIPQSNSVMCHNDRSPLAPSQGSMTRAHVTPARSWRSRARVTPARSWHSRAHVTPARSWRSSARVMPGRSWCSRACVMPAWSWCSRARGPQLWSPRTAMKILQATTKTWPGQINKLGN